MWPSPHVCGPHRIPCSTRPLALHTPAGHGPSPTCATYTTCCTCPLALGSEAPGPHSNPAPSRSDHSHPTRAPNNLLPCTAPSGPHPIPYSTHTLALCAPAGPSPTCATYPTCCTCPPALGSNIPGPHSRPCSMHPLVLATPIGPHPNECSKHPLALHNPLWPPLKPAAHTLLPCVPRSSPTCPARPLRRPALLTSMQGKPAASSSVSCHADQQHAWQPAEALTFLEALTEGAPARD